MSKIFEGELKESCRWSSDEQLSFKYFLYTAFVREISPTLSGGFGCSTGMRDSMILLAIFLN